MKGSRRQKVFVRDSNRTDRAVLSAAYQSDDPIPKRGESIAVLAVSVPIRVLAPERLLRRRGNYRFLPDRISIDRTRWILTIQD